MTSQNKEVKMKRATATRLVTEVQKRIKKVNADPSFCYKITRAVVFGSYVNSPKSDMISDLDVALKLECKYDRDSPEMNSKRDECKSGDSLMVHYWPMEEVMRYVRNRHPYISIHRIGRDPYQDAIIFSKDVMELEVTE